MPNYYIYRISSAASDLVKQLEKIDQFESYREAKTRVKALRQDQEAGDSAIYKIMFAESELEAEERLQEKREAPIIQEWEK